LFSPIYCRSHRHQDISRPQLIPIGSSSAGDNLKNVYVRNRTEYGDEQTPSPSKPIFP
jgi:hypothetical protein